MSTSIEFIKFSSHLDMSQAAANYIVNQVRGKKRFTLCPAAGKTPRLAYQKLVQRKMAPANPFKQTQIIMLDEWVGLPREHPASCRSQIMEDLIVPLGLKNNFLFNAEQNPEHEINRLNQTRGAMNPIDLCILGLGVNGHIGLNEPAEKLQPFCHKAVLSKESSSHQMLKDLDEPPIYGLTLGMQDILQSVNILLLVSGPTKKKAFKTLRKQRIGTWFPASFLWLHPAVSCFYTRDVLS